MYLHPGWELSLRSRQLTVRHCMCSTAHVIIDEFTCATTDSLGLRERLWENIFPTLENVAAWNRSTTFFSESYHLLSTNQTDNENKFCSWVQSNKILVHSSQDKYLFECHWKKSRGLIRTNKRYICLWSSLSEYLLRMRKIEAVRLDTDTV